MATEKRLNVVRVRLDDATLEAIKAEAARQRRPAANLMAAVLADFAEQLGRGEPEEKLR